MSESEEKNAGKTPGPDDLRGSAKINMTDEELIYFSMGPWDMEQHDPGSLKELLLAMPEVGEDRDFEWPSDSAARGSGEGSAEFIEPVRPKLRDRLDE